MAGGEEEEAGEERRMQNVIEEKGFEREEGGEGVGIREGEENEEG